jgi:hypothetical protein
MACLSLLRSLSPDFSLTVVPGANKLDIQILQIQRVVFDKLCRASTSSPVSLLKIVDGEGEAVSLGSHGALSLGSSIRRSFPNRPPTW